MPLHSTYHGSVHSCALAQASLSFFCVSHSSHFHNGVGARLVPIRVAGHRSLSRGVSLLLICTEFWGRFISRGNRGKHRQLWCSLVPMYPALLFRFCSVPFFALLLSSLFISIARSFVPLGTVSCLVI